MEKDTDTRAGYAPLDAIEPVTGRPCTVWISRERVARVAKGDLRGAKQLAYCEPYVLAYPTAIFRGLKREGATQGLLYVGVPPKASYGESGVEGPPPPGMVLGVYVIDGVAYHARWFAADNSGKVPEAWEEDLEERAL
ncbi:MAG: hypothetical protein M9894_30795 [Planctomycetes bacterium]|nr:hypothetical protein [Planctomycetota bacterium]